MASMRRWFLIAMPLADLLTPSLWLAWGGPNRVTRAKFNRIEKGMTRPQVDELLGQGPKVADAAARGGHDEYQQSIAFYWDIEPTGLVPTNEIKVTLEGGKVINKGFYPWTSAEWWERLRGRLGL
jgi:hypothetical protein